MEAGGQLNLGERAEPLAARAGQLERVEHGLLGRRHAFPFLFLEAAEELGRQARTEYVPTGVTTVLVRRSETT